RRPDLHRQHGLAALAGAPRGGEEMGGVRDTLDGAEDDLKFWLNRKVVDEIADRAADLAAAGGEVREPEPELVEGAVDRSADRAALGDDCDRPLLELLQRLVRDAAEIGLAAGDPHAVGADDGQAGLIEHRTQSSGEPQPLGIAALAEARRVERAAPGAGLGA